ncbi:MAG: tetratricopeptide repeat protein, partial [Geminicoccaceae bacterium]
YDPLERSLEVAEEAARLDPFSTMAKRALYTASLVAGDVDTFRRVSQQALDYAPNNPELLADFGNKLAITGGDWDGGARYLHRALGLNPDPPPWYFLIPALRAIVAADYDEALRWTKRMNTPDWFVYQMIRAIAFSGLKNVEATREALLQLRNFAIDNEDDGEKRMRELNLNASLKQALIDGLEGAYRLDHLIN